MHPLIPHSEAPSPISNPDNRAKESVLYKTGWGQGSSPVRVETSWQRGQASPRQSCSQPQLPRAHLSFLRLWAGQGPSQQSTGKPCAFSLSAAQTPLSELGAGWSDGRAALGRLVVPGAVQRCDGTINSKKKKKKKVKSLVALGQFAE